MSYFNRAEETEVIVDASPVGLGGLLVQDGKVISFASRAFSAVESRYSQTEREMLAIVWALEHFHLYLYGSEFTIVTDHKPLLGIFKSHKPTSARMDRWKLRLMPYNCHLVYRPGKDDENPADFMSRHPNHQATAERKGCRRSMWTIFAPTPYQRLWHFKRFRLKQRKTLHSSHWSRRSRQTVGLILRY